MKYSCVDINKRRDDLFIRNVTFIIQTIHHELSSCYYFVARHRTRLSLAPYSTCVRIHVRYRSKDQLDLNTYVYTIYVKKYY